MTAAAYPAREAAAADRRTGDLVRFVLVVAAVLGVIVRAAPVVSAGFPLNDGGLFAAMSADLLANGFVPPAFTSYNGGDIPFAYPHLGLYLDASVAGLLDVGPEVTLRILPLLLSILTIPAFYHMIRRWLDPTQAAVAVLAWALVPRAWMWGVAGGGITRSLGMLLAFLAVAQIMGYVRVGGRRRGLVAGVLSGLTLMAHVEAAAFVAATVVVAGLVHHRSRTLIGRGLVIAVVALIVAAPWWAPVVLTHGTDPLLAAGQSRSAFYPLALAVLVSFGFTGEPYLGIVAILGLVGLAITIACRRLWLPAWIVAIFVALPGGAATYAMVPWSMLVAIAVVTLVRLVPSRRYGLAVAMSLVVLASSVSLWARDGNLGLLTAISAPQRDLLTEAGAVSSTDARFLVVTGSDWPTDAIAEWMPALSARRSVGTIQGLEFSTGDRWAAALAASDELERCRTGDGDCLLSWADRWERDFDYVLVPLGAAPGIIDPPCCRELTDALADDARFSLAHAGEGGYIFEVADD